MKTGAQVAAIERGALRLHTDSEVTDAMLVAKVLNGDRAAFELLVRRHQAALFRRARWMGLEDDIAADMVQDALIKAYENLSNCRDPNRFYAWAGQILRNKCLDFLKSAARRGVALPVSLPAKSGNPEQQH